jgi:hypothetical protein
MPLDTSIALNANAPQPTNPLQTALQVAQFRAYNANGQAAQQGLDANRAISRAYQQATDPKTGQVDNNKLMAIISQDPAAGFKLGDVVQGINTQKQQQQTLARGDIGLSNDQLDSAQKHLGWAYQTAGSIANNPNATASDVTAAVGRAIDSGQITPQIAAQALADMPGADSPKGALQQWAANHVAQAAGQAQQLGIMLPKTGAIDKGDQILLTNTNPVSGDVAQTGSINKALDPATATAPVPVYQNGVPGIAPRNSLPGFGGSGSPPPLPSVAQPANMPTSNGQAAPLPSGPAPGAPAGFVATGAPMGADKVSGDAATRYGNLQQAAQQAKPLMQTYDLAAQALKGTMAGKGANAALNVPALLNTFGIQAGSDAVKNNQLLANYLNSAADQAAASLGLSGSDSRLAAAKAGQPDPNNMNGPALLESINHVKGLQQAVLDRQQATTNFLAQNGNNTSSLPQFEAKWNQSFNPDVSYIRSLGSPEDQQAAMQKLKASGHLQQWTKDYQAMKALGAF